MQTTEYGRTVLRELRQSLLEPAGQAENLERCGEIQRRPGRRGLAGRLGVLFRDLGRMECLFGYRVEVLETPGILREANNLYPDPASAARVRAENVMVLFEEEVLPQVVG